MAYEARNIFPRLWSDECSWSGPGTLLPEHTFNPASFPKWQEEHSWTDNNTMI